MASWTARRLCRRFDTNPANVNTFTEAAHAVAAPVAAGAATAVGAATMTALIRSGATAAQALGLVLFVAGIMFFASYAAAMTAVPPLLRWAADRHFG